MGFGEELTESLAGPEGQAPGNGSSPTASDPETRWERTQEQLATSSIYHPSSLVLGLAVGAVVGGVLILILVFVVFLKKCVSRKRSIPDLDFDELAGHNGTRSAPNTRSSSPHVDKRHSKGNTGCSPDMRRHSRSDSVDSKAMLMRSLTAEMIPDFELPPERTASPVEMERRRSSGRAGLQAQASVIETFRPDLYSTSEGSTDVDDSQTPSAFGRLWFSMVYDAAVEELKVTLVKAKQLKPRDKNNTPRDPFVRIYLLPDDKNYLESRVKKRTLTPKFNEDFLFNVGAADLMSHTLRFSVYDVDKRRVRHSLGHVFVALEDADLTGSEAVWKDLEPMSQNSASLGEMNISLAHMPNTEKLKVVVSMARNIRKLEYSGDEGVYVRVQLMHGQKVHKTKRTACQQGSSELAYNESILFTVPARQLGACSLVVSVMLAASGRPGSTGDEEYGRIILGPHLYARGDQLAHWQEMTSQPRVTTTRWHLLTFPPAPLNSGN